MGERTKYKCCPGCHDSGNRIRGVLCPIPDAHSVPCEDHHFTEKVTLYTEEDFWEEFNK